MKKFLARLTAILAFFILAFGLVACADNKTDNDETDNDETDNDETEFTFVGTWNAYKYDFGDYQVIIGENDEEFDAESGFSESIKDAYKIVFNEDGTAVYTEEWQPVACNWSSQGNTVTISTDDFSGDLEYKDGYLICAWDDDVIYFKK